MKTLEDLMSLETEYVSLDEAFVDDLSMLDKICGAESFYDIRY